MLSSLSSAGTIARLRYSAPAGRLPAIWDHVLLHRSIPAESDLAGGLTTLSAEV